MRSIRISLKMAAVAAAFSVAPLNRADAQSVGKMLERHFSNAASDVWAIWTSPFRSQPRDWLLAGGVVAGSAALSPLDDEVDRWAVRHRNDAVFDLISPFREGGSAFTGKTVTPIALGTLIVGVATRNQAMQDGVFGCSAAYLANYGVRHAIAYPLIARTRPDSSRNNIGLPARDGDQYDISVPGGSTWGRRSTPGGHVASVAMCAEFLTKRFDMGIFEPVPWILAGSVGMARIVDRRHWLSDQALGALFGYAIGKEVAIRQLRRLEKNRSASAAPAAGSFVVQPSIDGWRVGWTRDF